MNWLLKHVIEGKIKGQEDEEEDVNSYWMALRKTEGTGISKRQYQVALVREIALEEVMNLSKGRPHN
jgi:hypothetical protein